MQLIYMFVNNNIRPQLIKISLKRGDTFAYNRIPVIDMIIKLGPSTNPITNMFKTELHVCKQQHTPTDGPMCTHVSTWAKFDGHIYCGYSVMQKYLPFIMYYGSPLLLFTHKLNCLQIF